jgi:hypothetical protein
MKHLAGGMEAARSDLLQNYQVAPEAWLSSGMEAESSGTRTLPCHAARPAWRTRARNARSLCPDLQYPFGKHVLAAVSRWTLPLVRRQSEQSALLERSRISIRATLICSNMQFVRMSCEAYLAKGRAGSSKLGRSNCRFSCSPNDYLVYSNKTGLIERSASNPRRS